MNEDKLDRLIALNEQMLRNQIDIMESLSETANGTNLARLQSGINDTMDLMNYEIEIIPLTNKDNSNG